LGGRRLKLPILSAFVAGAAIVGALVLPYNALLTGSPTTFPINAYVDKQFGPGKNDLGFGPDRGFGWALQPFPGHSPLGAMVNANLNTFSINTEMFGWSTGSLLFVAFILFSASLRKADLVMLAVCAAVFTAYFFYYYSGGPDFGARYWFLMVVPCAVLTVRGMQLLQARLSAGAAGGSVHATRVTIAVLALSLMALANYFPWRAIDKYQHLWGMRPDMAALAQQYHFGRSLVLVRGPEAFPDYMSAAIYNPLDFHANAPIYAWDRGADVRAQLLAYYADRPVWVLEGPSITHAGFRIIQGPVSPQNVAVR
jgi:hypothetical protein